MLHDYHRRLDLAASRVRHFDFRRSLALVRGQLDAGTEAVINAFRSQLAGRRATAERLAAQLDAFSPMKILERGYALVFDSSGRRSKTPRNLGRASRQARTGSFTAEASPLKPLTADVESDTGQIRNAPQKLVCLW